MANNKEIQDSWLQGVEWALQEIKREAACDVPVKVVAVDEMIATILARAHETLSLTMPKEPPVDLDMRMAQLEHVLNTTLRGEGEQPLSARERVILKQLLTAGTS